MSHKQMNVAMNAGQSSPCDNPEKQEQRTSTLFNLYKNSKPIPEYPGNVRAIKTKKEWNQLREESKRDDWCGPCRSAAPIYAEMSKDFDGSQIIFAKLNASKLDVRKDGAGPVKCFPTIKLYDPNGAILKHVEGFKKTEIIDSIEAAGIKRTENKKKD
eukprot:jgi/Bigna1/88066/estExt_fgenesh1_pg.C_270186